MGTPLAAGLPGARGLPAGEERSRGLAPGSARLLGKHAVRRGPAASAVRVAHRDIRTLRVEGPDRAVPRGRVRARLSAAVRGRQRPADHPLPRAQQPQGRVSRRGVARAAGGGRHGRGLDPLARGTAHASRRSLARPPLARCARARRHLADVLSGDLRGRVRFARLVLFVVGALLLGALVAANDPAAIVASITGLSWRLAIVLCFPASLVMVFDTLGWHYAFPRAAVAFPALLGARLAGEAFNMITPTAALGGEAVKAWLLRGRVAVEESVPSLIVAKTTITIAQGLFLLLGIVVARWTLPHDSPLLVAMQWLLVVEVLALTAFVLAQAGGLVGWTGKSLSRLGPLRALGRSVNVVRVDDELTRFYREEPRRLILSIGFHLVAWLLGVVETYMILAFLGVEVSWGVATVIEAFGTAIRIATFLIPASLGAVEGGFAVIFAAFGLAPAAGLSFSLVRRLREAFWIGLGLLAFAIMRPGAGDRAESGPRASIVV